MDQKGFAHLLLLLLLLGGIIGGTILVQQKTNWLPKAFDSGGPVRGREGDLWADVVIGQRDFSEIGPREIVPYRVHNPNGVIVDRSVNPGIAYVWDSGNNRILGFNLGKCYAKSSSEPCGADIVIGQPSGYDHGACNGDSAFQRYPQRAKASASTLCGIWEGTVTVLEDNSVSHMAVDGGGNLYVPDFRNHRVLKYNNPLTSDTIADEVWGQDDFSGNECNKTGDTLQGLVTRSYPSPVSSSLCFMQDTTIGAGVALDSSGNLWVADGGNTRVLRFPKDPTTGIISKTADLVLGQRNFTEGGDRFKGNGMNQMASPMALQFDSSGKLYVADPNNLRVLVFEPPFTSGMSASRTFGSGYKGPDTGGGTWGPAGLALEPNGRGIFVYDDSGMRVRLIDFDGNVVTTITPGHRVGGSMGIDARGNLLVTQDVMGQDIYKFTAQGDGSYSKTGSLLNASEGYNLISDKRMNNTSLVGVAVAGDQLLAGDGRLLFWNGLNSLTNGKEADGYAGAGSFFEAKGYTVIKADADNRVWAGRQKAVDVFQTPLTTGAAPIKTITRVRVLGRDQYIELYDVFGLVPSFYGEYLWVAEPIKHRVFRISNPLSDNPVVDIVLGQQTITPEDLPIAGKGNTMDYFCNRNATGTPDRSMLCKPGALSIDKSGNLFVSDHTVEDVGNYRLLMFAPGLFPNSPGSVIFAPLATKEFPNTSSQTHATFEPAFDSKNRMVVGYSPYTIHHKGSRFISYYLDPTKVNPGNPSDPAFAQPDGQFKDYYGWPVAVTFDSNDNLYVYDANRSRILIYKKPLTDLPSPAWTPRPSPTRIPSPTPRPSPAATCSELFDMIKGRMFTGCGKNMYIPLADINKDRVIDGLDASTLFPFMTEELACQNFRTDNINPCSLPQACWDLLKTIKRSYYQNCGQVNYNPKGDLNRDQTINDRDLAVFYGIRTNEAACTNYLEYTGNPCPPTPTPRPTDPPTPPSGPSCTPCRADFDRSGTADRGDLTALQNSGCYGKPVTAVDKQGKPCIEWSLANKSTIGAYDFTCLKSLQGQRCLSGASALSSGTLPSQAAAYWKFDEGKGVLASNSGSLGSGVDMTLGCTPGNCTPSTWSEKGKAGKALNFDGVNDYGIVKDNPALKPDSSITVSAWFNTSDLKRNQRIISKTENGGYQISLNENSACGKNTLCFLIRIGNSYKQASVPTSQLSPNTWYFVVGIYDGSNVKLYLDGVLKAITPASGKITHSSAPLCVGMEAGPSSCKDNPFVGIIDELKIYNRALSL